MNKVILMGRLTRDPEVRYGGNDNQMAIAKFSLAVNRRFKRAGESADADFLNCTAFGKQAEFVERYLTQGTKILLSGRIENNNYTNREGQKVYGVQIMVDEIEFAESKSSSLHPDNDRDQAPLPKSGDGFMNIPDGVDDEDLPFN